MEKVFDLVIVGAGCVGVAAAYYAVQKGWSVCLIESQGVNSDKRYWSSSFSARQNRLQYNEEYLTRYVVASNKEWADLEEKLGEKPGAFLHKEGALWFGDKNVSTSEGNIKAANAVITVINSAVETKD
jgi:glycine/D-amino acid oxidase-like deaminating enzyme